MIFNYVLPFLEFRFLIEISPTVADYFLPVARQKADGVIGTDVIADHANGISAHGRPAMNVFKEKGMAKLVDKHMRIVSSDDNEGDKKQKDAPLFIFPVCPLGSLSAFLQSPGPRALRFTAIFFQCFFGFFPFGNVEKQNGEHPRPGPVGIRFKAPAEGTEPGFELRRFSGECYLATLIKPHLFGVAE
jgi:hypothetical protein